MRRPSDSAMPIRCVKTEDPGSAAMSFICAAAEGLPSQIVQSQQAGKRSQ
jgi:hypothetical protein